jgi:hypothetical protein
MEVDPMGPTSNSRKQTLRNNALSVNEGRLPPGMNKSRRDFYSEVMAAARRPKSPVIKSRALAAEAAAVVDKIVVALAAATEEEEAPGSADGARAQRSSHLGLLQLLILLPL